MNCAPILAYCFDSIFTRTSSPCLTVVDLEPPSESASDIAEGGAVRDGYFMVPSESSKRTDRLRSLTEEEGPEKTLSFFFCKCKYRVNSSRGKAWKARSLSLPLLK